MIKIFCDKCGKEIQEVPEYLNICEPYKSKLEIKTWNSFLRDYRDVHLCKECHDEVYDLIFSRTKHVS